MIWYRYALPVEAPTTQPRRILAPATLPVTVEGVRAQARLDSTAEDLLVLDMIEAAVGHLDGIAGVLGRCLIAQGWRAEFRAFGVGLAVPLGNVLSVDRVTWRAPDGAVHTLDPSAYRLVDPEGRPYLVWREGASLPSVAGGYGYGLDGDAVAVEWTAGYGADPEDVPRPIRRAITAIAAQWYEFREPIVAGATVAALPFGPERMLAPYRVAW